MANTFFDTLINKWGTHEFSSGSYTGDDFNSFARSFKTAMNKLTQNVGAELVNYNKGHYYISGFIKRWDKYVYFSISDVRHLSMWWIEELLVRTAKHAKDYTGGANRYTELNEADELIDSLLNF